MQKDPYLILGISENSSEQEIDSAYYSLRKRYSEDRFLPGDEGRLAAEKLSELDEAYQEAIRLYNERQSYRNYGSSLGEIENLIKSGQLEKAQAMLDNIAERTAEWHYLQSIIFYRKNWHNESLKQLKFAVSLEPDNRKYSDAYRRLKNLMYGPPNQEEGPYDTRNVHQNPPPQQSGCCSGSGEEESCCLQLLCAQCICQLLGGCH